MLQATECTLNSELTVALCILTAEIEAPAEKPVDMALLAQAVEALQQCAEAIQAERQVGGKLTLTVAPPTGDDVYVLTRTFGGHTEMLWGGDDHAALRILGKVLDRADKLGGCFVSTVQRWVPEKYPAIAKLL